MMQSLSFLPWPAGLWADFTWATFTWADLIILALQTALVLAVGLRLPSWLGMQDPGWRLRFWQLLLVLTLLLPLGRWFDPPSAAAPALAAGEIIVLAEGLLSNTTGGGPTSSLPLLQIWLLGCVLRVAWLGLGCIALARWRRQATPIEHDPAIDRALLSMGLAVPFLRSGQVATPVTFGMRRPVVLVPQDFAHLDEASRHSIACHELTHVRRHDALRLLLEECLRALLWFHPAVWWLLPRISLCREQLVDRAVLQHLDRSAYLRAICHYAGGRSWSPAPALSPSQPSHLRQRVLTITQEVSMSTRRTVSTLSALGGLLACTALAALTLFPWSAAYAGDGEQIYRVEGDVQAPVRTHGPAPGYPEGIAKEDRKQGKVVIQATINRQGTIDALEVSESLDEPYDQAAMDAIKQWRFEPATLDGETVSVYYFLTINFKLE